MNGTGLGTHRRPRGQRYYRGSRNRRLDLLVKREAVVTATGPMGQNDFQNDFNVIGPLDCPMASLRHLIR
jgi:hypothetical protein